MEYISTTSPCVRHTCWQLFKLSIRTILGHQAFPTSYESFLAPATPILAPLMFHQFWLLIINHLQSPNLSPFQSWPTQPTPTVRHQKPTTTPLDRSHPIPILTPNLLEQFHFASPVHRPPVDTADRLGRLGFAGWAKRKPQSGRE